MSKVLEWRTNADLYNFSCEGSIMRCRLETLLKLKRLIYDKCRDYSLGGNYECTVDLDKLIAVEAGDEFAFRADWRLTELMKHDGLEVEVLRGNRAYRISWADNTATTTKNELRATTTQTE